jgi:hypothetical protein
VQTTATDVKIDDPPPPSPGDAAADDGGKDGGKDGGNAGRRGWRRLAGWTFTVLAALLVLFALLLPNKTGRLTPEAFVRIPVEALLGAALVLVLPARARRVVAALAGVVLGLMVVIKILDMGFYTSLARPFNPALDWILFDDAMGVLTDSIGRAGAIATAVAVVAVVLAVIVLLPLAVLRLTRLVVRHRTTTTRAGAVLAVAWLACAALGAQFVPGMAVADRSTTGLLYHRALQAHAGLNDQREFAVEAAVDPFRDTPGDQLLTGLRGKDVVLAFIESYGRDAVQDPKFAPQVGALLEEGNHRLAAAGFASRSAFLTSPTSGGGSWLAHATLASGLWINNEGRYRALVSSDRLTLSSAFRRADWRTAAVMPALKRAWPEGDFYEYERIYGIDDLGYRGPRFSWAPMPDQYTLSAFERLVHTPGHAPVMTEIPLVSSHMPWAPVPRMIDWNDLGDGSVFGPMVEEAESTEDVWRSRTTLRAAYRRSIEYSLNSLISYVQTYGDDNLVLVFLGDHQPTPIVVGDNATWDVPITIVARDPAVLDRISGWGWDEGLKPGPGAPVWPMSAFRDRFLTAYGPQPQPAPPTQPAR